MDGEDKIARLILLDSDTADARLLEEPCGVSAFDFLNLFFGTHSKRVYSNLCQCHLQGLENISDMIGDRVGAGAGKE
jgi:hypothetical protein